jgi:hypothetical protein
VRQVGRAERRRLARSENRAVRAHERRLAQLSCFLGDRTIDCRRQSTFGDLDHIGAELAPRADEFARLLCRLRRPSRRAGRFEAGAPDRFIGEPGDAGERTRPSHEALVHGVAMRRADLARDPDVDGRRDAVVQHHLAVVPLIAHLRVPESGQDELAIRANDLRVRRQRDLAPAGDSRDAIPLHHDDHIRDRGSTIAIDERAAIDDERRRRLRAEGHECHPGQHGDDDSSQRTGQQAEPPDVGRFHDVLLKKVSRTAARGAGHYGQRTHESQNSNAGGVTGIGVPNR